MSRRAAAILLTGGILAGAAAPGGAAAQSIDPARPQRVVVTTNDGARGARVDPTRTGRAPQLLPTRPQVTWRRSLAGPLEVVPVVAPDGRIAVVVGGSGEVRFFSPRGEDLGAAALDGPAAEATPAFLTDGTLVVITASGHAAYVGRDGVVRRRVALGLRAVDALTPTPTRAGGVVIAGGRSILELDSEGRIVAQAGLEDAVSAPAAVAAAPGGGHEALVATSRGDLVALLSPFAPRRVTSLGGIAVTGVAIADDGAAWASVGGAIVRVERRGGAVPWRVNASSGVLASHQPPTLTSDGGAAFVGIDGSLVVLSPAGEVRHRVALDRVPATISPTAVPTPSRPIVADDGPPLLVDAAGTIAFARPSGRVGVVSSAGRIAIASERLCTSPVGIAPAGPGAFVVGCGEGGLVGVGEAGGPDDE